MKILSPILDRQGHFSALKSLTLFLVIAPLLWLSYRAIIGDLGPLAVKEAIHVTGDWAIRLLVITLAITPAMRVFNLPKLAQIRRMVGVAAFAYAAMHFGLYIVNSKFDLAFVASEIWLRYYLLIGFAALVGLSVLAATSTDRAIRELGPRWKSLHKFVYGISIIALLHAFMQYKLDASPAALLVGFFELLMIYRIMMKRKWAWSFLSLATAALAAGLAAAATEFAWYHFATGANAWKILSANFMVTFGLRPAVIVTLSGLAVAVIHPILPAARKFAPSLMAHARILKLA